MNMNMGSSEMDTVGFTGEDTGQMMMLQKGNRMVGGGGGGGGRGLGNGNLENWGDSGVVAGHSQQTDTSTDTDDRNQNQMKEMRDNDVDHVLTEEQIVEAVLGKKRGSSPDMDQARFRRVLRITAMGWLKRRAERAERKAKAARRRAERKRAEAVEKKAEDLDNQLCNVKNLLLQNMEIDEPSYEDSEYDPDSQEEAEEEEAQSASDEESVSGSEPELETEDELESDVGFESEFESAFDTKSSAEE